MVKAWRIVIAALVLASFTSAWAAVGPVLIVHDGTAGLEANVLANLTTHLTTAGNTVSANVGVPAGSLAANRQIWDIRFNNTTPLSASDITAYITYMAGGGSLFVMGENTGFLTRDNSIASLVLQAGGGTITITTPANTETVQAPFSGPNALSTITFLAAAGVTNPARGACVTRDAGNLCASVVWGPGNMANAMTGSLIVVFDVNFLDPTADANSQTLTDNMIAYLITPTAVAPAIPIASGVPTLSELGMLLLTCGLIAVAWWKMPRTVRGV
jgi:hypothetical protein